MHSPAKLLARTALCGTSSFHSNSLGSSDLICGSIARRRRSRRRRRRLLGRAIEGGWCVSKPSLSLGESGTPHNNERPRTTSSAPNTRRRRRRRRKLRPSQHAGQRLVRVVGSRGAGSKLQLFCFEKSDSKVERFRDRFVFFELNTIRLCC